MFSHGYNYQFCSSPLDYKREGERGGRREEGMVVAGTTNSPVSGRLLHYFSLSFSESPKKHKDMRTKDYIHIQYTLNYI